MAKRKKQRGPKPNHLQLDNENWKNALKKAIQKKKLKKVGQRRIKK